MSRKANKVLLGVLSMATLAAFNANAISITINDSASSVGILYTAADWQGGQQTPVVVTGTETASFTGEFQGDNGTYVVGTYDYYLSDSATALDISDYLHVVITNPNDHKYDVSLSFWSKPIPQSVLPPNGATSVLEQPTGNTFNFVGNADIGYQLSIIVNSNDDSGGDPVPDGGTTAMLLGTALSGLGLIRRSLS